MTIAYLASPYSHENRYVRLRRFVRVCQAAAALMQQGVTVFAPIAHSHPIGEFIHGKAMDHAFWMAQDLPILAKCDKLIVLKLEGWEHSRGVAEEIDFATLNNIPVEYMEPTYI